MPSQTEKRGFSLFTIPTLCCYCLLAFTTNATKVNAFVISPSQVAPCPTLHNNHSSLQLKASKSPNSNDPERQQLTHADIEWRLIAPEGTSRLDRWKIKLGAFVIRAERKIRRSPPPPLLCPRGGQALLEAYYKEPGKRKKKIGRFGITTARGPSSDEIDETIRELYKIDPPPLSAAIAAVIYMFVEPDYRSRNVGALALEVISAVHAVQGVDFTVLVADDNGSGRLVKWYEDNFFLPAPLMQNILGSPDSQFGVAMISPVRVERGFFDRCLIKWW